MSGVLRTTDFCKLEKIIKFIEEKGKITPKEAEIISGKSAATARQYLKILVRPGMLKQKGKQIILCIECMEKSNRLEMKYWEEDKVGLLCKGLRGGIYANTYFRKWV